MNKLLNKVVFLGDIEKFGHCSAGREDQKLDIGAGQAPQLVEVEQLEQKLDFIDEDDVVGKDGQS